MEGRGSCAARCRRLGPRCQPWACAWARPRPGAWPRETCLPSLLACVASCALPLDGGRRPTSLDGAGSAGHEHAGWARSRAEAGLPGEGRSAGRGGQGDGSRGSVPLRAGRWAMPRLPGALPAHLSSVVLRGVGAREPSSGLFLLSHRSCLWVQCLGSVTRAPPGPQWPQPDSGCTGGRHSVPPASVRQTPGRLPRVAVFRGKALQPGVRECQCSLALGGE